ncbi:MAG: hypothetical protein J5691_01290 [Bacilli bacterium]|nr:hypothetical protein [Bacilli bacterium]
MTDFINYPTKKYAKPVVTKKVIITESTKEVVEEAIGEKLEDLTEDEVVQKVNESKKAVAKKTRKGVKVKQSLNG